MDESRGPQKPPENLLRERHEKLGIKVLLADDDESIRRLYVAFLKSMGCTAVEAVANGKLLMDKLETGEYDLVIVDYKMPIMDGMQVLDNIRADVRFRQLPVIVCSGNPAPEAEKGVKDLGGVWLWKPFSFDELFETVRKVVEEPGK